MAPGLFVAGLAAVFVGFFVSAAAGMGGSLVIVPVMVLLLGVKQGVAVSALLLGANNVVKLFAYRTTIPWRSAAAVVALTLVGAFLGATLLVAVDDVFVQIGVVVSLVAGALIDVKRATLDTRRAALPLAFAAGATSGFSGTSGPLKGLALRLLKLDRMHLVGAASFVSFANDISKAAVYVQSDLISTAGYQLVLAALPLTLAATFLGHRINHAFSEKAYAWLFWAVMTGYGIRLLA